MTRAATRTARHWIDLEAQRSRLAAHRIEVNQRHGRAQRQVQAVRLDRAAELASAGMQEADVRVLAERRAELLSHRIDGLATAMNDHALLTWLNAQVQPLQGRAFAFGGQRPEADQLRGFIERAKCPRWWFRQLDRAVRRETEAQAIAAGQVCATVKQWYASDAAVRGYLRRQRRNRHILEHTELENDEGERFTLAELSDMGTANKEIRRGELMTRIRGCEEWADAHEHPGVFFTLTAPSRFHRTTIKGRPNPKWDGSTPRQAQQWLRDQWAAARAALARAGVKVYGFRVAEPHHDGCPHWHALLWADSNAALAALCMLVRRYWLQWDENEDGARERRCTAVRMVTGGASGYVAKYIAKNIDDAGCVGAEGHTDDWSGEEAPLQGELWVNPATRVQTWASDWGIRQFQAIGQPPVTVWRELRRVKQEDADAAESMRVQLAWDGVHRVGEQRACWHTYLDMQGGPGVGRDHFIKVANIKAEHVGRYETAEIAKPCGVYDVTAPEVVKSHRRKWVPRVPVKGGEAPAVQRARVRAARSAAPRTRFNNCTRGNFAPIVAELLNRLRPPAETWNVGTFDKEIDHGNDPPRPSGHPH